MNDFLQHLLKYLQQPSTKMRGFIGKYDGPNSIAYGPFLTIAKERTSFPYMVYDIADSVLLQGFGDYGSDFGEQPWITFHLYDDNADRLFENSAFFVKAMDTLLETGLPNDESCVSIFRNRNPRVLGEQIGKEGLRVYHHVIEYRFGINENKGEQG